MLCSVILMNNNIIMSNDYRLPHNTCSDCDEKEMRRMMSSFVLFSCVWFLTLQNKYVRNGQTVIFKRMTP